MVNDVFKDSRRLYWITTSYGLNRFNGQDFKLYTKEKNGLHSNILDITYEDKNKEDSNSTGMIWLLTGRSVSSVWFTGDKSFQYSIFNPYTEQVIDAKSYLGEELYNHLQHLSRYQRKKDHLVLLTTTGYVIKYFHRDKVEIQQLNASFEYIVNYKELSDGSYWISDRRADYQSLQLFSKDHKLLKEHQFCYRSNHICEDRASCPGDLVPTMTSGDNDSIWFDAVQGTAIKYGLHGLSPTGKRLHVSYQSLIPNTDSNLNLHNVYHDDLSNNFWLSDRVNKTYIVHPRKKLRYTFDMPFRYVWSQDENGLFWAANSEGLYAIQFHRTLFKKHFENVATRGIITDSLGRVWAYPRRIEGVKPTSDPTNFSYNRPLASLSMLKDEEGTIWSFCRKKEKLWLGRFDQNGQGTLSPLPLEAHNIWSIYKDEKTGLFWGGGLNGLLVNYDPKTQKTEVLDQFNDVNGFKKATT
ncbi:MAG: hypothetical protein AAF740_11605, partial [Bacteroidota bacterium]